MEIINGNSFATASYDAQTRMVYYEFVGVISVPLGMETLRKVMLFAEQRPVRGIVSNLLKLHGTFTNVTSFFEKEYYPHMIKNGLQCTAIVVPNDVFTKYAVAELTKKAGHFQLHVFQEYKTAEGWVKETIASAHSSSGR
jgi:hypothetical protein